MTGKKIKINKTDAPRVLDDTQDVTQELAEDSRLAALYDASMRELTMSEFNAMLNDAVDSNDVEAFEQASAWREANGDAAFKAEEPPHVETADEKWLRGVQNAVTKLGEFDLSQCTKLILARACENVASNKGFAPRAGTSEAEHDREVKLRTETLQRAALFAAFGNDLPDVLECLREQVDLESLPGLVYSTCFSVQKAANFACNLMYRRALDKARDALADGSEGATIAPHDYRDHRESPCGLGPESDEEVAFDESGNRIVSLVSGIERRAEYEVILEAYEDLHLYLQLLTEQYGWDIDAPMPYMYVSNLDGTFAPIWGAEQTLDMMEVRSKASAVKRIEKRSGLLEAALAGARAKILKAGKKVAA